ncbi:hypothetical protein SAMN02745148_03347 [Modicisalibacter ilicicola DSM 19980]|uniref:Hemolysin n=1 Tax=Modicisalibacter ilicicola DSM 19980 TaxID=1121942 RepID=A0A1M5DVK9_9GAMM|nr:hypothetical protein [Halomonas ilicicola]SHF70894.1 hypothetical protein SAMN02745148_03347 [Halomonas ilicicola DSM 19980]
MPSSLLVLLMAINLSCVSPTAEAQEITRPAPADKPPYDIALDYCAERGGLAQYSVKGEEVRFTCGDDLTTIITISS